MNGLLEILTTRKWMISPEFVHSIRDVIERNMNGHASLGLGVKSMGYTAAVGSNGIVEYATNEEGVGAWEPKNMTKPFFNVVSVDGPITRNGGACSYGSIEFRDMVFEAANNPLCLGHLFVINTPGGSAWAKNDFQQAIDYAHDRNQPVLAFVDGMCCSAGMYLAALCDERYYMHPKDEIGCIGVMAAFYTQKDGSKNEYTNETYHELYDPESFEKNKWVRDVANDDKTDLLVADLAALGVEFRADVKANCPNATDEHLHGKIFAAEDVKGILMDGQSTVLGCFQRIKLLAKQRGNKASESLSEQSKSNLNMDKKYQNIATACGVNELVMTEEGTHLDLSLCDKLAETLGQAEETKTALDKANETIKGLEQQLEETKAASEQERNNDFEGLKKEQEAAIAALTEANEKAMAEAKAEADKAIEALKSELDAAKATLKEAEQKIADRDEQIQTLTAAPAETEGEESPASNGTGAEQSHLVTGVPQYDPTKSPSENRRAMEEYERKLQATIGSKTSI